AAARAAGGGLRGSGPADGGDRAAGARRERLSRRGALVPSREPVPRPAPESRRHGGLLRTVPPGPELLPAPAGSPGDHGHAVLVLVHQGAPRRDEPRSELPDHPG